MERSGGNRHGKTENQCILVHSNRCQNFRMSTRHCCREQDEKIVRIMEVTCAWTSLVVAREKEKREKYEALATDIARLKPGWRVTVHPLVVGDLGSLAGFKEELQHTRLFDKRTSQGWQKTAKQMSWL